MAEVTPQIDDKTREQADAQTLADQTLADQTLAQQKSAATPKIFGPIAAKGKKGPAKESVNDPMAAARFSQMGPIGQFFVNMLLLLTQFIDPDNKSNNNLVGMISKAFGFEGDEKDPEHRQYRELRADIKNRGRNHVRDNSEFRLNNDAARDAIAAGAAVIARNAPVNPTERQSRVMSVLPDAAKSAGVSSDLAVGMWGYESSFGKNLRSNTGCEGDFQFTRTTLAETVSKKGTIIAANLNQKAQEFGKSADPALRARAADLQKQATVVETMHSQTKGMNGEQLKSYASKNKDAVDAIRNAPEASTYAGTQYMKMVADQMKLNPHNSKDYGLIYAGYNIGVGNALDIKNGRTASGWEVNANAGVAGKGSAAAQRSSYDRAIASRLSSAEGVKFSTMAENSLSGGTAYAKATPTGKTLSTIEPISASMKNVALASKPETPETATATPALRPRDPRDIALSGLMPTLS